MRDRDILIANEIAGEAPLRVLPSFPRRRRCLVAVDNAAVVRDMAPDSREIVR